MKRVAPLSPSSMYDMRTSIVETPPEWRRRKIFTLPPRVAIYNSQWDHVCTSLVPPVLPEDVASSGAGFPPGTRAKALLRRSVIPKLIERLFCRHVQEGDLRIIRLAFVAAGVVMAQGTP